MVEIEQVRSFLFKLFATILIFCLCQVLIELSNSLISENEESRFKRSVEENNKEVLIDLPGQMQPGSNSEQFIRKKRLNVSTRRFIPTEEWQEINTNHIVPSGLHYRINLETGKKEAKLLNKNGENKSKELLEIKDDEQAVHQHNSLDRPLDYESNSVDKLKTVKKLQKEFDKFKFDEKNQELNIDKNLNNWRSMDQIKKEFKDLDIKLSTDTENVHQLFERYRKTTNDEEKITILKDLEFTMHQFDVSGSAMINMNGFDILKDDFLNSKNTEIQSMINLVFGSAASSNPPVKIHLVKSGLLDQLITKLSTEKSVKLNLKTIYAISAIVRQFPYAQQLLIEKDGLKIMKQFFIEKSDANAKNSTDLIKMQIKIISLLTDLMDEYRFTLDELHAQSKKNSTEKSKELSDLEEKMKQYNQVNLEQTFLNEGFCLLIPKNLNINNFDVKEKVLKSMYSFRFVCRGDLKFYLNDLNRIKQELNEKIAKEQDDFLSEYYQKNLVKVLQNLIDFLSN